MTLDLFVTCKAVSWFHLFLYFTCNTTITCYTSNQFNNSFNYFMCLSFCRWIIIDHTGSFLELPQDVLPPLPSPERRCGILAGPGQGEQWRPLQRDACRERQSPGQALPSVWPSAALQSLHHTGGYMEYNVALL